ncbi:hypothetical protein PR003_g31672 [Phytophthora rubi]|uniref:Uncharacterized protein n=1 Tax=Phytophthora rubi TaxID=129364 RepID=A0A6A4B7X5_9STRA|nr:hypothetical protein PR003_g31672 [Phytophthora rubi]
MAFLPHLKHASSSAALNTILPMAAPGDTGRPLLPFASTGSALCSRA